MPFASRRRAHVWIAVLERGGMLRAAIAHAASIGNAACASRGAVCLARYKFNRSRAVSNRAARPQMR